MSWGDVDKSSGGGDFLKLDPGTNTKLHVLSEEPYSFRQIFNQDIQRGCIVPEDYTGKGAPWKHALLVFDYSDNMIKAWVMGKAVAGDVRNLAQLYQGLHALDIQVGRIGSGLKTKYSVAAIATTFKEEMKASQEEPNLSEMFAVASEAEVQGILAGVEVDKPSAGMATDAIPAQPAIAPAPVAQPAPVAGAPLPPAAGDSWGAPPPAGAPPTPPAQPALPAEAPIATPVATATPPQTKPAPATNGSNPRVALMQRCQPKLAGLSPAKKASALKFASKSTKRPAGKTILSQFSGAELEKLAEKIGA